MIKKTFSFLTITIISFLAFAATTKAARANWHVNSQGWLIYETNGNILGDKDEKKENERKTEEKKEEPKEEAKKENREQKQEVEYFDANQNAWVKAKTEGGKTKTEIQYLTGEKLKTETEGDKKEAEFDSRNYKVKLKAENGTLKLEAETETGETSDLGEDNEIEIENKDDDKIRVATGSADGEIILSRNRIRARTNFPLSIDLKTNELIVTTPNGVKQVTVLPDQAIDNLLTKNVIDRVELKNEEELELTEENGEPVYEVSGESDQKLLGMFPVKIKAKIKISAETGKVVNTQKTVIDRLVDLFSF